MTFLNKLVVEYKGATINTCLGNYKVKQRQFISSFSSKVSCFFFVFLYVLCFYQYDTHIQQQRFVFTRHALIHLCLFFSSRLQLLMIGKKQPMCISDGELTRSRRPIIWCSLCLFYFFSETIWNVAKYLSVGLFESVFYDATFCFVRLSFVSSF